MIAHAHVLGSVADKLDQLFIGGEWRAPSGRSRIDVINPSTEETFISVAGADALDVDLAVSAARAAFDRGPWPRMSHVERAAFLLRMADEIERQGETFGAVWTSETGVVSAVAASAGPMIAEVFRFYASLAETFPFQERHTPSQGKVGLLVREPVGTVAAIVPWNASLALIAYKIAPALLAGCSVIIKSAPEAPASAYLIADIAEKIGLPSGVLNILTAERDVSELLVRHPDVDKVTFTGSSHAGKIIAGICGGRIARCTLELGGKSAAVVMDDYDIGEVAEALSASTRFLSGQVCASLTRVVVRRDRHDDMVDALGSAFQRISVGDPLARSTDMGPLAMRRQRDRVESYIAKGLAEGARLVTGGKRPAHLNRGFYFEPTVFGNVDNAMVIAREEIFGPVVSVISANDEDQAIAIANDSDFGLNASVFTNDAAKALDTARRLRVGTVGHNAWRSDFSIAFGGFKQSGVGREGGVEGLYPFVETKTIILDALPEAMI